MEKAKKTKILRIRVSEYEANKLEHYASKHQTTMSQVIREYLRRLPTVKTNS